MKESQFNIKGKFKFAELATLWELLSEDCKAQLNALQCSGKVGKYKVITDLNSISYGQYIALSQINEENVSTKPFEILTDIPTKKIPKLDAKQVMGFLNMVGREMQRIADLFKSCAVEPTPIQIKAGIQDIPSSPFNTIDWYARRMGITDHDEVLKKGWQRIYACAKIDADKARYEQRLSEAMKTK